MGCSVTARVQSQSIDLVFLGSDGFLVTLFALKRLKCWSGNTLELHWHHVESLLSRLGPWCSVNLVDRLNSLLQPDDYGDNAPEVFYLFPILPSSPGGGR
jgi:hypothetical protein